MSALRFGGEAVRAWADYSGDFNPIHFDERLAEAAIGKGGTVVHGMLAMMPLKASQSVVAWEGEGWLQWAA
ncbi:MAG: MaoC/PaaZ C-terminal domain-containing protein, partial [Hyphomicrobiaceae bacterium]